MTNNLRNFFPMIRTRRDLLEEIGDSSSLSDLFHSWSEEQREDFLDFCTGSKGVKILYDSFFKEIMNPETTPERLERLLSLILKQQVKIHTILPTDNSRIADESSLLVMDILIELEDGSLANIEVQKLGYKFPGQRCACYSADLLLRQYKRIRGEKKKSFSYKDIKKVYTIVLFEKSGRIFHKFPDIYLHHMKQKSDTGLEIELLQEYIFIPLDIFQESLQNKGIKNDLDAWLAFLSTDNPEWIEGLIRNYPEFIPMYTDIYELCRNTEKVMELYSKELSLLDKNTVQLMIDEMQDTIDGQKSTINKHESTITQLQGTVDGQKSIIDDQQGTINKQKEEIEELRRQLENQIANSR